MKAIQIRYLPATNFKGARMKAWTEGGNSIVIPYSYEACSDVVRVRLAVMALIEKLGWNVEVKGTGSLPNGDWCAVLE